MSSGSGAGAPEEVTPVPIDVGGIVSRTVATLYSSLVTRPTGRAVRLAIEEQLPPRGQVALSVVDLSQVLVLDYSCADEVIAGLLLRHLPESRPREAYFIFEGIGEGHRDPVEEVLHRHGLAAVVRDAGGPIRLAGVRSPAEEEVWGWLEEEGAAIGLDLADPVDRVRDRILAGLAARRLLRLLPDRSGYQALSRMTGR